MFTSEFSSFTRKKQERKCLGFYLVQHLLHHSENRETENVVHVGLINLHMVVILLHVITFCVN